jgi:hypothetical protein
MMKPMFGFIIFFTALKIRTDCAGDSNLLESVRSTND